MILTVALDVTLDVYYMVDNFALGSATQVSDVVERAGGPGIDVARVLTSLGEPTLVVGAEGGVVGAAVTQDLRALGIEHVMIPTSGQTRRRLLVSERSSGIATMLDEVGPSSTDPTRRQLEQVVMDQLPQASVLVLAGEPPAGLPWSVWGKLTRSAQAAGVSVIWDSGGPALLDRADAAPQIVKIKADQIMALTGDSDPVAGAYTLLEAGAESVVVSLGALGMCMVSPEIALIARPTSTIRGSTRGAGEAAVAALAIGLMEGFDWEQALVEAVALSAAAVAHPISGEFDRSVHSTMRDEIQVEEITEHRLPTALKA